MTEKWWCTTKKIFQFWAPNIKFLALLLWIHIQLIFSQFFLNINQNLCRKRNKIFNSDGRSILTLYMEQQRSDNFEANFMLKLVTIFG